MTLPLESLVQLAARILSIDLASDRQTFTTEALCLVAHFPALAEHALGILECALNLARGTAHTVIDMITRALALVCAKQIICFPG